MHKRLIARLKKKIQRALCAPKIHAEISQVSQLGTQTLDAGPWCWNRKFGCLWCLLFVKQSVHPCQITLDIGALKKRIDKGRFFCGAEKNLHRLGSIFVINVMDVVWERLHVHDRSVACHFTDVSHHRNIANINWDIGNNNGVAHGWLMTFTRDTNYTNPR